MYTRRAYLSTGALGLISLAGCTDAPISDPKTATDAETPPSGAVGRIQVVDSEESPTLPVRPRVAVAEPYVTAESTSVLRVDVENTGDEAVAVGEYRAVVFWYVHDEDGAYVLLPHSERSTTGTPPRSPPDVETTDGNDCWRLASGVAVTAEYGTVEIPAGGTLTAFAGLYTDHETSACLPTGEFDFRTTYAVDPLAEETPSTRGSWGFSLSVEPL
ncbi:hypothetical protein [Halosegnis sp.]|uniref:hypothetical protein n=1 Tax=Halosegnis sp. TaxID=2864959 RepID=UPI0035D4874F